MNSEDRLINRIRNSIPSQMKALDYFNKKTLPLGIGDDAAVISPDGNADWVFSCDAFMEGVHFWEDRHPGQSVGYKALVRATSDLAAMGATPRFFMMTLALPAKRTARWLDEFIKGMRNAAKLLEMTLIGGDTTKFPLISVSITVIGNISRGHAVKRSGAQPGDLIFVSGKLGRAQLGLELMQAGAFKKKPFRPFLLQHLYPEIRIQLGCWLAKTGIASAMMDISDGLSTDLGRLCSASGVGARLDATAIPCVEIPPKVRRALPKGRSNPLTMALHGGEDYELLFTIPPQKLNSLRNAPGFSDLTRIGRITRKQSGVVLSDGSREHRLQPRGWDPFREE